MKTIGNKIKELRRSKGMSQKDIADKLTGREVVGFYVCGKQMGE